MLGLWHVCVFQAMQLEVKGDLRQAISVYMELLSSSVLKRANVRPRSFP